MPYKREKDFAKVWLSINSYLESSLPEQAFQIRTKTTFKIHQPLLNIKNNLNLKMYEYF